MGWQREMREDLEAKNAGACRMRAFGFLAGTKWTVLEAEVKLGAEKDSPLGLAASVVSGESFGAECRTEDGKTNPRCGHGVHEPLSGHSVSS